MQGASQAGSPHSEASRRAAQLPTVNIAVLFLVYPEKKKKVKLGPERGSSACGAAFK